MGSMNTYLFFVSLCATGLLIHLLRFPHLVLENGGGAFLILFFVLLHFVSFPLLVAERCLDNKLQVMNLKKLKFINQSSVFSWHDKIFVFLWHVFRMLLLFSFFSFFLYLSGMAFLYVYHFAKITIGGGLVVSDLPILPEQQFTIFEAMIWSGLCFVVFYFFKQQFMRLSTRFLLPFFLLALFILFVKILLYVTDTEGFKILLYPDFSSLHWGSLSAAIGHSLICLVIGLGFYNNSLFKRAELDSVEFYINAILQALFIALLTGVMALPMIRQFREIPFGSNWIFATLPRWLSYGEFGSYYTLLFFLAICYIGFHICILLTLLMVRHLRMLMNWKENPVINFIISGLFILLGAFLIVFLQEETKGWSGQSALLRVDRILIEIVFPFFAILLIWIVFRFTTRKERMEVFSHQQMFFHNKYFFAFWEKILFYFIPTLIIVSWLINI